MLVCTVAAWIFTRVVFPTQKDKERYDWSHDTIMKDTRVRHMLQQQHRDRDDVYMSSRWMDIRLQLAFWAVLTLLAVYIPKTGLVC